MPIYPFDLQDIKYIRSVTMPLDDVVNELYTQLIPSNLRWAWGESLFKTLIALRRKQSNARLGTAFIGDLTIKYLEFGRPQLPKMILLHGLSDSKDTYITLAQNLASRYHILVPDLPGFGESEKPTDVKYDLPQYSGWIFKFAAKLKFDRFILVGHSLGGAVACEMAHENASKIQRLVLIGSGGLIPENDGENLYEEILRGENPFEISAYTEFLEFMKLLFRKPPFIPLPMKNYLFMRYKSNKAWYHRVFSDLLGDVSTEAMIKKRKHEQVQRIGKITVPTLIIWGKHDGLFPPSIGKMFHETVKNSRLVILENSAHMLQIEEPQRIQRLIRQFAD